MQKATVFLTGGSSFIGKNLREQLGRKYTILTPTHGELDLLNTDDVSEFFLSHSIDIVIHGAFLGGNRSGQPDPDIVEKNLKMFFNITKNKTYYKKLIFLGSGAEYDKRRPIIEIKESEFTERIPQDHYGFSKYVCSSYALLDQSIIVLRLFGVFGKYEDITTRFISQALCRSLLNLPIIINQNVYFDYIYINDLVSVIDFFITHDSKQRIFNVGTGNKIDLVSIAKKVQKLTKSSLSIEIRNKGLQNEYTCDNSRLRQEIKNITFSNFDKNLEDLCMWYQKHPEVYAHVKKWF